MSNSRVSRLFCLAIVLASLCGCASGSTTESALLVSPDFVGSDNSYITATASYGTLFNTVEYYGTIDYTQNYTVTCAGFGGMVLKSVNITKGASVSKGDVLAEFQVSYSKAELDEMKSNLEILQLQYSSGLGGYKSAVTSAQNDLSAAVPGSNEAELCQIALEKAQNDYDYFVSSSEDAIDDLQEQISKYEEKYSAVTICAPESGVITSVATLLESTEITDTTVLCTIGSPDSRRIVLTNKTQDAYRVGDIVQVTGMNPDGNVVFNGLVIMSPDLVNGEATVIVSLPDSSSYDELKAKAKAIVVTAYSSYFKSVLIVPADAVINEAAQRYVNILDNGTVKKRYVTVGSGGITKLESTGMGGGASKQEYVQILDGLSKGDEVIRNQG